MFSSDLAVEAGASAPLDFMLRDYSPRGAISSSNVGQKSHAQEFLCNASKLRLANNSGPELAVRGWDQF